MPEYSNEELQSALLEMTTEATHFEQRAAALEDELGRVREWRKAALVAIVVVAVVAMVVLGAVAFNAVDDEAAAAVLIR